MFGGERYGTLSIESSDSFVASTIVSIATGWSEPVHRRELHPLKPNALSPRTFSPTIMRCRPTTPGTATILLQLAN